jgi:hypothetical protein
VPDSRNEGREGAQPPPLTVLPPTLRMAPMPSPKQMVTFYDPDQFEEFVKEWVPALDAKYVLVERHGGSGDHGIDVAGYLSRKRLEGMPASAPGLGLRRRHGEAGLVLEDQPGTTSRS